MAPFSAVSILTGLKDRIESILYQGDTLYLGTSTGTLTVYSVERKEPYAAVLLETKPNFTRRSIERLDYIRDINSLITLSDGVVTLSPLSKLHPQTPLTQARNALSFATHVSVQMLNPDGDETEPDSSTTSRPGRQLGVPTVVTQLAIGCRKKIVIYTWKDGELQGVRELNLPHSPRGLAFCNAEMLVMGYTPTEHAVAYLNTMSVAELSLPSSIAISPSTSAGGMGKVGINALTGLGGYVVGLASKTQKPSLIQLAEGEVLVTKECEQFKMPPLATSFFIGPDGKLSRKVGMTWALAPDDTAFVKPYVLSILPASSALSLPLSAASRSSAATAAAYPRVQVRSSLSLSGVQLLLHPFLDHLVEETASVAPISTSPSPITPIAAPQAVNMRLLTASPGAKSPAFLMTTPADKSMAAAQGSTIWLLIMQGWELQIDELVDAGKYTEALMLLDTIDQTVLENKPRRVAFIRSLHAVDMFSKGHYDEAINIFLELDTNPAKVVALYPEAVSGRLCVPRNEWISLFGGKDTLTRKMSGSVDSHTAEASETPATGAGTSGGSVPDGNSKVNTPEPDVVPAPAAEAATAPSEVSSTGDRARDPANDKQAVETLLRYLSDRRPKLSGALALLGVTPAQAHLHPTLSSNSVESLLSVPDGVPVGSLVPEQLLRLAQIVDTALFKSYLVIRPSLIGSLCRLDNWCEVQEVEEELRAREKFSDLIDLYRGKKMHQKALQLIHDLSLQEEDIHDKLDPAVRYLQKLGAEHLDLIFRFAKWVLDIDHDIGLQIFAAEDAQLPREEVSEYLLNISPGLCAGYMEYLISEAGEANSVFHDRLAELYLQAAQDSRGDDAERDAAYQKLLHFIKTSEFYSSDRLFARLPSNGLFEARAVLLGKLDKHEAALEIYVHRLHNYDEAEEHCKHVYQRNPDPNGIFLTLLRTYLRTAPDPDLGSSPLSDIAPQAFSPTSPSSLSAEPRQSLLIPALELIARHSARLDSNAVIALLPPLIPISSIQAFLLDALDPSRTGTGEGNKMNRVIKEVWKARKLEVDARYVSLRSRRVRVTDTRICPQCHKRIGGNVIAVHSPRGEVTHYGCREAFAVHKRSLDAGR